VKDVERLEARPGVIEGGGVIGHCMDDSVGAFS
jgi:hypothetical protein